MNPVYEIGVKCRSLLEIFLLWGGRMEMNPVTLLGVEFVKIEDEVEWVACFSNLAERTNRNTILKKYVLYYIILFSAKNEHKSIRGFSQYRFLFFSERSLLFVRSRC